MVIIHQYKGYNIVKAGTKKYPWNIYKYDDYGFGYQVSYGRTLEDCKSEIDNMLNF